MFHLAAFGGLQNPNVTFLPIAPIPDQQIPNNQNNQFIMPSNVQIWAAYMLGGNLIRGRINNPTLRQVGLPDIFPFSRGNTNPSLAQLDYLYGFGPVLPKNDPLEIDTSTDAGAVTSNWAFVWLSDQNRNVPVGPAYKIHATSPGAAAPGFTWQPQALTVDQVLPYGTYSIVGMQCQAVNMLAGRLIFVGGGWRPGTLAVNAVGDQPNPLFQSGNLGEFGRFESNAQPSAEIIANGAVGTVNWYLDLVKIA